MFRTMAGYCACRRVSPLRSWPAHEPAMDRGVLHGFGVAGSTTPLLVLPPLANVALIESRQVQFRDARLGNRARQRLAQIGGAMGQSIPLICQDYSIDARGRHDVSTGSMMSGAEEARLSRQRAAPTDSASPRARSARREPIVTRRSSALTRALYRASHATGPNKKSGRAVISTRCFNRSRSCP
jgi:hypothetical protein